MSDKAPYRESNSCGIDHQEIEAAAYEKGVKKGRAVEAAEERSKAFLEFFQSGGGKGLLFLIVLVLAFGFTLHTVRTWPSKPAEPVETRCQEFTMDNGYDWSHKCPGRVEQLGNSQICRCPVLQVDAGAP